MPSKRQPARGPADSVLDDTFAAPHPPDELLAEGCHGAVLDEIVLPPLSRGERWRKSLMRFGLPVGNESLRAKLAARQLLADLRRSFGSDGAPLTHPAQLSRYFSALLTMQSELHEEIVALESGLAGLLIQYRYKYSVQRGLMCYYSKIAKKSFKEGMAKQRIVSKIDSDDEKAQVITSVSEKYCSFLRNYVFSVIAREDVLKSAPLFSDFITATLFLARIREGEPLLDKPDSHRLPRRDQLLFIALRDPVLIRAAEQTDFQHKTMAAIREFPE